MNVVNLIGRLVRDPDVRYNDEQKAMARFSIAIDRGKDKPADYPNCIAFGKTAELIEKYCTKGKQVGITGSLRTGAYEKDGVKHYMTDVVVDRLDLLGSAEKKEESKQEQQPLPGFEMLADDIPF